MGMTCQFHWGGGFPAPISKIPGSAPEKSLFLSLEGGGGVELWQYLNRVGLQRHKAQPFSNYHVVWSGLSKAEGHKSLYHKYNT